jgi:hypothetical protein
LQSTGLRHFSDHVLVTALSHNTFNEGSEGLEGLNSLTVLGVRPILVDLVIDLRGW